MHRKSIILVQSCFSRQDALNDTHDDAKGPTLHFGPGHVQGRHIAMDFIMCGVTPSKRAVLPECYQTIYQRRPTLHRGKWGITALWGTLPTPISEKKHLIY